MVFPIKILTWNICNHPELKFLMMVNTDIARLKEITMFEGEKLSRKRYIFTALISIAKHVRKGV